MQVGRSLKTAPHERLRPPVQQIKESDDDPHQAPRTGDRCRCRIVDGRDTRRPRARHRRAAGPATTGVGRAGIVPLPHGRGADQRHRHRHRQNGRFVSGLRKEDFRIYEDDQQQTVTHFNAERVPVSLGIVLDTSGSMDGREVERRERPSNRFLFGAARSGGRGLPVPLRERPELVEGWTTDRAAPSALRRIHPRGGTALYDAVAERCRSRSGQHRKKALRDLSDGNDTNSQPTSRG